MSCSGGKQREIARQHVAVGLAQVVVGLDRLDEGHALVHPAVAQVHLVDRIGALDRVAQRGDEPRLGEEVVDALRRVRVDEVVRRRLADRGLVGHVGEERLVFLQRADRELQPLALALVAEEARLLELGHEDLRVRAQVDVQRGGAGLGRADDEEVRQGQRRQLRATGQLARARLVASRAARAPPRDCAARPGRLG